ncbi:MAG: type II secretion system protein [Phycisphaerales bacterium]|nr:type II secretion system protein [Phycisphaerales bacterium]
MHAARAHPGFTLIELLVTLIIIGVLAGLAAPRLLSTEERRAETTVRAAAALMTSAAQRSVMGREPVALVYGHEAGELRLEVLRPPRALGTERDPKPQWGSDPFLPAIRLETMRIAGMSVDGRDARPGDFRIEITPGTLRPTLAMMLRRYNATAQRFDERGRAWLIELPSYASTARVVGLRSSDDVEAPQPIDLDQVGQEDSPW